MRVVFMGTPEFAVASLDAVCHSQHEVVGVVTVPDRQAGRGLKVVASPVKEYAVHHGLPFLQPEKLRDETFLNALRQWRADVFVVVAFRMLPQVVWAMPPRGTFNLHASLLPQYRGAAPINWAIINGERESGVTTFMLNERIDEGALLMQERCPIGDDDNAADLHDRLMIMGCRLVVATLDGIAAGTLTPMCQPQADTLKPAPKIFKPDCAIQWNRTGMQVRNFVRGLSPYPAATMTFVNAKGEEVAAKVYAVSFTPASGTTVGTLENGGGKTIKIGVADGYIDILSLQISGKKRISAEELLRGYDINDWKVIV